MGAVLHPGGISLTWAGRNRATIASERASSPVEPENSPNGLVRGPWTIPTGAKPGSRPTVILLRGSSYCPRTAVRRHETLGHSASYSLGIAPPILWSSVGAALTTFTPGPRARRAIVPAWSSASSAPA